MLLVLLILFFSLPNRLNAKDLGVHGNIYDIKEQDVIEYIKQRLFEYQKSGKIDEINKSLQNSTKNYLYNLPPLNITKAQTERTWYYDPSISLDRDLEDHEGTRFYQRGTKVNPLDHMTLSKDIVFIDGSDEKHVAWALKQNAAKTTKIILTNGNIIGLMREHKIRFYYDKNSYLINLFGIRHVPALVSQDGNKLLIKELVI